MSSQSNELAALLAKHRPGACALAPKVARALVRHAKALHRLYERDCDTQLSLDDRGEIVAHERAVERLCKTIEIKAVFNGDPRGFPVKLHLGPNKTRQPGNGWGGAEDGWGIG